MAQTDAPPQQDRYWPTFSVGKASGVAIPFQWTSMPGNLPKTNKNTVLLWQTAAVQVPNSAPLATQPVGFDDESGSDVFRNLQITSDAHLVAYAVGSTVANIVMLAKVDPTMAAAVETVVPEILITWAASTLISYTYSMPPGTRPEKDKDWVGLWQGVGESALYTDPPIAKEPVTGSSPRGGSSFGGIKLLRGTQYTIGYFKGGWDTTKPIQTTLACSTSIINN